MKTISVFPAIAFRGKQNRTNKLNGSILRWLFCCWKFPFVNGCENEKKNTRGNRLEPGFIFAMRRNEVVWGKKAISRASKYPWTHPHTKLCTILVVWNKMGLSDDLQDSFAIQWWNRERAAPSIVVKNASFAWTWVHASKRINCVCIHTPNSMRRSLHFLFWYSFIHKFPLRFSVCSIGN